MSNYDSNITALRQRFPEIVQNIKSIADKKFEMVATKNNQITIRLQDDEDKYFYLHSVYNPEREAEQFAKFHFEDCYEDYVLYGFGLGYHVREALKHLKENQSLYVFELNAQIFQAALQYCDIRDILLDTRFHLFVSQSERVLAASMAPLIRENIKFVTYHPAVKAIPSQYEYFKYLMESWNMNISQLEKHGDLLKKNYRENLQRNDPNVSELFGTHKNKPIIMVSAGPSLDKNKHLLKFVNEDVFIFAVGRALRPLMEIGVCPSMFCIIDQLDWAMAKQIEGYESLNIPLVYLSTASSLAVSLYQGPKYIAYNSKEDHIGEDELIETGGSVATAVLDISIRMGANPIIIIGQDLAYSNTASHAEGSAYTKEEKFILTSNMRTVKGQNGEILYTCLAFLGFKYWIENKIKEHPEITFINATEGGVWLNDCRHMKLEEALSSMDLFTQ
jgi:hypothetical protein